MPQAIRQSRALTERAEAAGIEALALAPRLGDLNEDLQAFDLGAIRAFVRSQLAPEDTVSLHAPADSWDGMTEAGAPSPLTTPSGRP